ncbi:MAG: hypothetical protein AAGJ35_09540, partial [Myxococcota bacterium]
MSSVGATGQRSLYQIHRAKVLLSLESDFLGQEGDIARQSSLFATHRDPEKSMNRLYVVESTFSSTGAASDHRLRLQSGQVGEFLAALFIELVDQHKLALDASCAPLLKTLRQRVKWVKKAYAPATGVNKDFLRWVQSVAKDLIKYRGQSLVMVGESQPAHVQALGILLNSALENIGAGKPLELYADAMDAPKGTLQDLADAVRRGQVKALLCSGGNPVYNAPRDIDFANLLERIPFSVHHGTHVDETARKTTWYVPLTHFLEAWGDVQSTEGTVSIVQPLIAPLYDAVSTLEMVGYLCGQSPKGYDLLRAYWKPKTQNFEKSWRVWLHDGLLASKEKPLTTKFSWKQLENVWGTVPQPLALDHFELRFVLDSKVHDGRFANNPWLQELPDTMSKLTWDNAALLAPASAEKLKLQNGDWVSISLHGRSVEMPVFMTPGIAEQTIVLPLGYGREFGGRIAKGAGFDAYPLRSSRDLHFAKGAKVHSLKR